ncbi:Aste57867_927 [Aphanomyces stellatus]|uniref:Aste57867_927 protein n=1 Tax=Aphanomyces stellatus TaxID=120398 RepID=A0A485K8Y7_9STRA|nr:hypothetical protein As57867_000926 [Aphanomyces stellatus]VFT78151.1 Aste57867_927 [Aphanomyces stellatus]
MATATTQPQRSPDGNMSKSKHKHQLQKQKRDEEIAKLKAQIAYLDARIVWMSGLPSKPRLAQSYVVANQILRNYNASLRRQASEGLNVTQLLECWVAAHCPMEGPAWRSSWIETTLVKDPVSRLYGYQWLSEKLCHTGVALLSSYGPVNVSKDTRVRTCDTDDGLSIEAMETYVQATQSGNFKNHAAARWFAGLKLADGAKHKEVVNDRLMFYEYINPRTCSHSFYVAALFEEPTRVVITVLGVHEDESIQIPHGEPIVPCYNVYVYDRKAESETLFRQISVVFTPMMADSRPVSLARIGAMRGLTVDGIEHREAYIQRIQSTMNH